MSSGDVDMLQVDGASLEADGEQVGPPAADNDGQEEIRAAELVAADPAVLPPGQRYN